MKRLLTLSLVALLATLSLVEPANAQYRNGWGGGGTNINTTQALLQTRISQGIQNGRLNQQEAAKLQGKLSKISMLEARMRNSGSRLSRGERNSLDRQLSSLNEQITRELNDFEHRRIGYWNFRNRINGNGYGNNYGNSYSNRGRHWD